MPPLGWVTTGVVSLRRGTRASDWHVALGHMEAAWAAYEEAIETARSEGRNIGASGLPRAGSVCADANDNTRAKSLVQRSLSALGDAEDAADVGRAHQCLTEWT